MFLPQNDCNLRGYGQPVGRIVTKDKQHYQKQNRLYIAFNHLPAMTEVDQHFISKNHFLRPIEPAGKAGP